MQHFRLKQFLLNLESIKFLLFYNVYLISGLLNGITLRYFLQPGNRKYTLQNKRNSIEGKHRAVEEHKIEVLIKRLFGLWAREVDSAYGRGGDARRLAYGV